MEAERQEDLERYQCHTPESGNLECHQYRTSNFRDLQRHQCHTREAGDLQRSQNLALEAGDLQPSQNLTPAVGDLQRRQNLTPGAGDLQRRQCPTPEAGDLRGEAEKEGTCGQKCWVFLKACIQSSHMKLVLGLLMGQFLSILLCGTGVTSQLLFSKHSVEVPTTQAFINYILLAIVYGIPVVVRNNFCTTLQKNWWKYLFLGLVDVEANYLVILAYKYTNLTTVQLLDSFAIAMVMALSCIFLRTRYKIINFMGVTLALIGVISLVLSDIQGWRAGRGTNPLLGDLLCLAGVALYAISNVAQEFLVKHHSIIEYLGFIGVTGSIISAVQVLVLERDKLARVDWNPEIGLLLVGFGVSQFLFYSMTPHLLRLTSAVVFGLSLLTADIYSLFFGLFLFHCTFSFFYALAFILIILGIFIYNLRLPKRAIKEESEEKAGNKLPGKEAAKENSAAEESVPKMKRRSEGFIISGLRGLLESQSYGMSLSGECASRGECASPNRSNSKVNRLARKLAGRRGENWSTYHKENTRQGAEGSTEDMLEVKELVGRDMKEGQEKGQSSSDASSCSRYGSVEKEKRSIEKHPSSPRTTDAEINGNTLMHEGAP